MGASLSAAAAAAAAVGDGGGGAEGGNVDGGEVGGEASVGLRLCGVVIGVVFERWNGMKGLNQGRITCTINIDTHLRDHRVEEGAGVGHVQGQVGEELVEAREALAELLPGDNLLMLMGWMSGCMGWG